MMTYIYQENGDFSAIEDEVGSTRPDPAMAPGRLDADLAIGPSPSGMGVGSASLIVGTETDGTPGSSRGPIMGRARPGSTPRGSGGASGPGGAGGRTIPATGDFEDS